MLRGVDWRRLASIGDKMYLLPNLLPWCNDRCWLSPAGVRELACLLLESSGRQPLDRQAAADLLRLEPGLVLWSAAGLQWRLDEPPTLQELSDWLAERGAAELASRADSPSAHAKLDSSEIAAWSRDAGAAMAVAHAVRLAPHQGAAGAETAALLRSVAIRKPSTPASKRGPAWLQGCASEATLPDMSSLNAAVAAVLQHSGVTGDEAAAVAWPSYESPETLVRRLRRVAGQRWLQPEPVLPLAQLAAALTRNDRLEHRFGEQLLSEKLAALKELAYGASHEINNPLANITTRAQSLLRDEQDAARRLKLEAIVQEGFRAHEMISDMMLFAKPPTMQRDAVDLTALTREVMDEVRSESERAEVRWTLVAEDEAVMVTIDRQHIASTLRALMRNAVEAVQGEGRVAVWVRGEAQWAEVEIEDSGPGLSPRDRRHLFDPFFSGREAGRGLGLGLSKSWTVVQQHGGEIRVNDELPTKILMRLPRRAC